MNGLKKKRLEKGYSQWRLAKESHCHQSRISLYELDLVELRPDEKERLANALGFAVEDLFPTQGEREFQ